MEKKLLKPHGGKIIVLIFQFGCVCAGIYFLTQGRDIGFVVMGIAILTGIIVWNNFHRGILCPHCKNKIFPIYKEIEDDKENWIQIQFPCEKCNILWENKEKINCNEKDEEE